MYIYRVYGENLSQVSEKREIILNTLVSLGNQISFMPLNR